ncbi:MAG TPA: GNAT family N-acetyltransferase [Thermoanaerobaculaceae bacterium]|nr:GNAT family N-acetyltransferase [Acidobacteriota bacterium]HPW56300.1 GNAT family N-acetyltransferase [Thermoanaerobaculaceae bacterium]
MIVSAVGDLPESLATQARKIQEQAWPPAPGDAISGPDPGLEPVFMVLLDEDHDVVATLFVLRKRITRAGRGWYAGELSAVATRADLRGQGLGHELVVGAREEMASMGLDLGIFTCDRPLREFHQRAGWEELPGTVLVGGTPQEPFASDQSMKRASKTIHSDLRWAV